MRRALAKAMAGIVLLTGGAFAFAPVALADVEPNDGIAQPEGPLVGGVQYGGTISTDNDLDWYFLYVTSQTQLILSYNAEGDDDCGEGLQLLDTDGGQISRLTSWSSATSIRYTTAVGTNRYLVAVSGCAGMTYQFQLDPAAGVVPGPAPLPATPTSEPNESREQAFGPLAGGVSYAGAIETQNDVDWYTFLAAGLMPVDVTLTALAPTAGGCFNDVEADLDAGGSWWSGIDADANEIGHARFTAPAATRYFVKVTGCEGNAYRLQVDPAAAVLPSLPATETPSPTPPRAPGANPKPPATRRCRIAQSGQRRWTRAVAKTKRKLARVHSRAARRQLKRKLAAQRRTLRRARDRVTIYCR